MNRFQKKILTIAAGIANVGMALSAAAVATYAWFAVAKQVQYDTTNSSGGMTAIVTDTDVDIKYEVLGYDNDLKEGVSYKENSAEFKLRPYDQWIGYNHRYENAILRCEVILSDFNASTDEINIDFKCSGDAFVGKANNIAAVTSNIIQFKSSIVSYKTTAGALPIKVNSYIEDELDLPDDNGRTWVADAAASYRTATDYFKRQRTSTSFVKTYKETASKYHKTVTEVPYLPISSNTSIYSVIMYVECSYNMRAVEYYINHRVSDSVNLEGDISQIKFYTSESREGGYVKMSPTTGTDTTAAADYEGDYIIANDPSSYESDNSIDYANMFDTTLDNTDISNWANFTQTETLNGGNLIKANSLTEKNKLTATQVSGNTFKLQTNEGASSRTIGKGSDNALSVSDSDATNTIKNNKAYVTEGGTDYVLGMHNDKSSARYGYYQQSGVKSNLYHYANDDSAKPKQLDSIRAADANIDLESNPIKKPVYGIGQAFTKPTIYATYSGVEDQINDIKGKCTFEFAGEDASLATSTYGKDKRINVYYNENGVTVSTYFLIDVLSSAYLTISPEEVTLDINEDTSTPHTANLEATLINQLAAPTTVTWSVPSGSCASVTKTSTETAMPTTATVTATAVGTTIVTCTVISGGTTYTATCRVVCRDSSGGLSEIVWEKVTSSQTDWSGRYLIVYEDGSSALDGSRPAEDDGDIKKLDSANNGVSVTISNDKISYNNQNYYFDIASVEGGYSIQSASGLYINNTASSKNQITTSTEPTVNIISYDNTNNCVDILATGGNYLRYNAASNEQRFRYYKDNDSGHTQQPIQLYKRSSGTASIVQLVYDFDTSLNPVPTSPVTQLIGLPFNPYGLVFHAMLDNGAEIPIDASLISFTTDNTITQPTSNVTVTATYGGQSCEIEGVNYENPTLTGLSIEKDSDTFKTDYISGGTFSSVGLTVYPIYNSNIQGSPLNDSDVTWYFKLKSGGSWSTTFPTSSNSSGTEYYVAAGYDTVDTKNASTHPEIKVYKKTLSSVSITSDPTNNYSYTGGANFSFDGTLTAYYNTGTAVADNSTVTPTVYKLCSTSNPADPSTGTTITTSTPLNHNDHDGKWLFVGYTYDGVTEYSEGQQISVPNAPTHAWTRVTALNGLNTTDSYVITDNADNGYYLNGTINANGHFAGSSFSSPTTLSNTASGVFKFEAVNANNNIYKMKLVSTSKYMYATKASSGGSSVTGSSDSYGWKFLVSSSSFNAIYQQAYSSKYAALRCYNNSTWRTYSNNSSSTISTSSGTVFRLYKYTGTGGSKSTNRLFVGDLSNSQRCELNGIINYDALIQNYFDIALGKTNVNVLFDTSKQKEYINCIGKIVVSNSSNYSKKQYFAIYNGLRSS